MSIAKAQFRGKTIEDMSRDELLEVIEYLSNENERHTSPDRIRAFALGSVEMLKRGEKPEPKPERTVTW